jgi:nicotinamidase-related amidase
LLAGWASVADPVPDNPHHAAVLLIDVINDFDFSDADSLLKQAVPAAQAIKRLRVEAQKLGVPVVYVNDNFGLWHSERAKIVEHCRGSRSKGRAVVDLLAPEADDYFVIKPRHSGFYATNLPVLLPHLKARRLVLTGFATDICVLFTANDAYMRNYALWVPEDCTAASTQARTREAVQLMGKVVKAETRPTGALALEDWLRTAKDSF